MKRVIAHKLGKVKYFFLESYINNNISGLKTYLIFS